MRQAQHRFGRERIASRRLNTAGAISAILLTASVAISPARAQSVKPCPPQSAQNYTRPADTPPQPAQNYTRPADTPQSAQNYTRPADTPPQPAQNYTRPADTPPQPAQNATRSSAQVASDGPVGCN